MIINKNTSIGTYVILQSESGRGVIGVVIGYDSGQEGYYLIRVDKTIDEAVFTNGDNTSIPKCVSLEETEYIKSSIISMQLFNRTSKYVVAHESVLYSGDEWDEIEQQRELLGNLGKTIGVVNKKGEILNGRIIGVDTCEPSFLCGFMRDIHTELLQVDKDLDIYSPPWGILGLSQGELESLKTLPREEMGKYRQCVYVHSQAIKQPKSKLVIEFMKPEFIGKTLGCTHDSNFRYVVQEYDGVLQLMTITDGECHPVTFNSAILQWKFYALEEEL